MFLASVNKSDVENAGIRVIQQLVRYLSRNTPYSCNVFVDPRPERVIFPYPSKYLVYRPKAVDLLSERKRSAITLLSELNILHKYTISSRIANVTSGRSPRSRQRDPVPEFDTFRVGMAGCRGSNPTENALYGDAGEELASYCIVTGSPTRTVSPRSASGTLVMTMSV